MPFVFDPIEKINYIAGAIDVLAKREEPIDLFDLIHRCSVAEPTREELETVIVGVYGRFFWADMGINYSYWPEHGYLVWSPRSDNLTEEQLLRYEHRYTAIEGVLMTNVYPGDEILDDDPLTDPLTHADNKALADLHKVFTMRCLQRPFHLKSDDVSGTKIFAHKEMWIKREAV